MQLFNAITFASLAAFALADQKFTLKAVGGDINQQVIVANNQLFAGDNKPVYFDLKEPSGFLDAEGLHVGLSQEGIFLTPDQGKASKDFGVQDGKLRNGPSIDGFDFFACNVTGTWPLYNWKVDDTCVPVSLSVLPTEGPSTYPNPEPTPNPPPKPSSYGNETSTDTLTSHEVITITSCEADVTDCPARTTTKPVPNTPVTTTSASTKKPESVVPTNAANAASFGAGAIAAAAIAMFA